MRVLIVDHFFQHDIEAMLQSGRDHQIRVVEAERFRRLAARFLPHDVFAVGLGERFALPEHDAARARYEHAAEVELRQFYTSFPFDAVVVPSDVIVYLRALGPATHRLGLPLIVLQKETTISPYTMTEDARVIGQHLPFTGDLMLVCSEHHKQFWINTGADADKIKVTGQPRFDFYFHRDRWSCLRSLGIAPEQERPVILFFSYDLGAYSPEGPLASVWHQLRSETETILIDLARAGLYNVIIKPHPQQQAQSDNLRMLRGIAGPAWDRSVFWAPAAADARQLIVNADTVVGFQTTALFEAMAAEKRVLYTFWTEPAARLKAALVPFDEMDGALEVARGSEHLRALLEKGQPRRDAATRERARREAEHQLGRLDGSAASRAWRQMEQFASDYARAVDQRARDERSRLLAQAPILCRRSLRRARYLEAAYALGQHGICGAIRVATVLGPVVPSRLLRRLHGVLAEVHRRRRMAVDDAAYSAELLRVWPLLSDIS